MGDQGFSGRTAAEVDETTTSEPQWEAVDSSRFTHMAYDEGKSRISIRWKSGTVGHYLDVPPEEYELLRASDSLGKHLQMVIIPKFKYQPETSSS